MTIFSRLAICRTLIVLPVLMLISISGSLLAQSIDPEVQAIQAKIANKQKLTADRGYNGSVRSMVDTFGMIATLTEEVILQQAKEKGVKATDQEAEQMLLPLLTQQGLIDPLNLKNSLWQSPNVILWLKGQHMEPEELVKSAKLMVLWAKLATLEAPLPSKPELLQYVEKHPELRIIPNRIQLKLTEYVAPPTAGTRGLLPFQVLSPAMNLGVRGSISDKEAPAPADWTNLSLYLSLETLDPKLRAVLEGKQVGDAFGPIILKNGASVAGVVISFLPQIDLSKEDAFWQHASLQYRLEKSATQEKFAALTQAYFNSVSPNVRGFWSSLFGGVKRGFKYVAAGVGGLVGFIAGGPSGAVTGARYGYQAGTMIQGFWSRPAPVPSPAPAEYAMPYNFAPRPYPDPNSYYQQQVNYQNYYKIPAAPIDYARMYEQNYNRWQMPYTPRMWAPPVYLGSSLWY